MAATLDESGRLETLDGSTLTKSTCFSLIEEVIQKNVIMKREQLHTFIELLNRNLLRQDNTVRILKIFMNILAKYEAGVYSEFPLFEETIVCIFTVLNKVMKHDNWDDADVKDVNYNALKLLIDIPAEAFKTINVQISKSILKLVETYLNASSVELPSHNKVLLLLQRLLKSFSETQKIEFVKDGMNVWLTSLMSFIFKKDNVHREFGLIIAEEIISYVTKMEYFDNPHWIAVYKNFLDPKKYPDVLITLLKNEDSHWHRLWIIIIKMSRTELHKSGGSINPLLFVIQEGFKRNIDIKCQSFECLRVLIDNFALSSKVLYNTSRIKVLSVALDSNNAKTEMIGVLKFDIWWHLLTLLQPKIKANSAMILLPFLRYCFSDPKKNLDPKRARTYPGEMFPKVQNLAIKSFVEICGHSNCAGCVGDFANLSGPVLDSELLEQSYAMWIYSLKQVTIYSRVRLSNSDRAEFEMLIKNLKCIWRSFAKAASNISNPENFNTVLEHLWKLLSLFVEEYSSDPLFAEIILMLIIPSLVDKDVGYSSTVLKNHALSTSNGENPINALINIILLPKLYHVETMLGMNFDFKNIIDIALSGDVKEFTEWLLEKLTPDNHCPLLWSHLTNGLANLNSPITNATMLPVLLWPINNYSGDIKLSDMTTAWVKLLNISKSRIRCVKNKSLPQFEDDILIGLENCNNNLLALCLLPEFIKKQSADRPADIVFFNRHFTSFMKYLNNLDMHNIDESHGTALCDSLHIFASLLDESHTYSVTSPGIDSLLSTINMNLKGLILYFSSNFKDYIKLQSDSSGFINSILKTMTKLHSLQYSSKLMTNVNGLLWILMKNVNDIDIDAKYTQLLANQKTLDKSELVKIQQLLKVNKKAKKQVAESLKNSFEKPSPITTARINKKEQTKSDEFVVIEPTWKFDPKKLTEHQRDVLKRRRDDIPALYEDLSQSQDNETIDSWRPPGYKSDTQTDSSMSQDITVNTFINKLMPKNKDAESNTKPKILSPFVTLKKIKIVDTDVTEKTDPGTNTTPTMKKSAKKSAIKKSSDISSQDAKNQSILTNDDRMHNTIMKESNIIGTPPGKDRLDQTPKNSPDVNKKNLENCEFASSPITNSAKKKKSLLARLNDSLRSLKGTSDDDDSPKEEIADVTPIVEEKPISPVEEIKPAVVVADVAVDNTPLTPTRPVRLKRKPSKFLVDESLSAKKRKDTKPDSNCEDKSSQSSNNSDDSVASSDTAPKKTKKNRLMSQLQIDTNEGHPLINSNKSGNTSMTRNTRRSLCKSDSQSSDKSSQSSIDAKDNVKLEKSIHSMDTECYIIPEEKSIFSQETESNDTVDAKPNVSFDINQCNQSESFDCSPDFIASSQEDVESVTSLVLVVSKTKDMSSGSEDNLNKVDTALDSTDLSTQQLAEANTEPMDVVPDSAKEQLAEAETEPILDSIDSVTDKSVKSDPEPVLDLTDLTSQQLAEANTEPNTEPVVETVETIVLELNEEETQLIAEDDNAANVSVVNTSIVSSPRKDDIEERNTELMNSTMDLSPIKGVSFSYETSPIREVISPEKADGNIADTPKGAMDGAVAKTPSSVISPDLFCNEKISPVKEMETSPPKSFNASASSGVSMLKSKWPVMRNNRAAHLIELCLFDNKEYQQEKKDYEENKKDNSPEKGKSIPSSKVDDDTVTGQSLLEFNKVIPCFTASPVGPILKRKLESDGLTLSPSSKKKRVSFHDPPVSTMVNVEKYIVPRTPKSPQSAPKVAIRCDLGSPKQVRMMVAKVCLMNKIKNIEKSAEIESEEMEKSTSEVVSTEPDKPIDVESENFAVIETIDELDDTAPLNVGIQSETVHTVTDCEISDLCSLTVESQQPLEIVTNHMLDDKNPIYPSLVDCTVSISEISSDLSSPLWNRDFLRVIAERILTIGDLAKLTELEINRLPLKSPKIDTVKKTLENYELKMKKYNCSTIKITESFFEVTFNTNDVERTDEVVDKEPVSVDVEMEIQEEAIESDKLSDDTNTNEEIVANESILPEIVSTLPEIDSTLPEIDSTLPEIDSTLPEIESNASEEDEPVDDVKIFDDLLSSRPDYVLKTVTEKIPHSRILDSVPTNSLMDYISVRINNDAEFSNEIKSRCKVGDDSNKSLLDTIRRQLSSDLDSVLNSFEKLVNS